MSKGKILIVEPDEDTRRMLEIYFGSSLGYTVQATFSVQQCIYALESFVPDMLLFAHDEFDEKKPDFGINEFTQKIIAKCEENNTHLIFLIRKVEPSNFVGEIIGSFHGYNSIDKPFDIEELALMISNAIETRRKHITNE